MAARGYLLEGDLYMARFVNGVAGDLIGPFEGTVFSMQPQSNTVDMISRGRNSTGEIIESVSAKDPTQFNITFAEANAEILAMALMGNVASLAQAAGNFSGAPFNGTATVTAKTGAWVALPRANLTGSMDFEGGTPASQQLTEDVDYQLNRQLGLIRPIAGGLLTDGEVVTLVSGAFGAIAGSTIQGGTVPDVRAKFIMDGRNRVDGADITVTVHEAIVAANTAVDFLNGGFLTTALQGRMKKPSGKPSAFEVAVRTV